MLNLLGLVRKNSMEESTDQQASPPETEDESSKDRPSSRVSTFSLVQSDNQTSVQLHFQYMVWNR